MANVEVNGSFGAHSVVIYNLSTGLPYSYGLLKVLGDVSWNNQIENVPLNGGSNPYPWAVGNGLASSELSFTVRQFEPSMHQYFGGAVFTETALSATGTVSSLRNVKGTSASNASTGVASVAVTSSDEADLKFGTYILKVASSTTVEVYALTDLDFNSGTDTTFSDAKTMKIGTAITITSAGASAVADLGITLTGGSGTIGMTTGDTCVFRVVPPHGKVYDYSYGETGEYPVYVGLAFYGEKQADGTREEILFSKVKANGLTRALAEKNWAETEITAVAVRGTNIFTGNYNVVEQRYARPQS